MHVYLTIKKNYRKEDDKVLITWHAFPFYEFKVPIKACAISCKQNIYNSVRFELFKYTSSLK